MIRDQGEVHVFSLKDCTFFGIFHGRMMGSIFLLKMKIGELTISKPIKNRMYVNRNAL